MADIFLTLKVDAALVQALDDAMSDAGEVSRNRVAVALLRDWLMAAGYLPEELMEEDTPAQGQS